MRDYLIFLIFNRHSFYFDFSNVCFDRGAKASKMPPPRGNALIVGDIGFYARFGPILGQLKEGAGVERKI